MKAIVYTKYGPPEVAQLTEIDMPVPKDDELLIEVYASTVNRTDCGFRSAEYFIVRFFSGLIVPKNKVLGCEFAGEVVGMGKNVGRYKKGDRVFGFNEVNFGGHAEYLTAKENGPIALIPEGWTFEEAAPLTEGVHYAYSNIKAAGIQKGQRVLINGGTGAIGSAAIQLLKSMGVEVTAVCHSKDINLVSSLGAEKVIDYTKEDFTKLDILFDVVFDAVGKSSFGKCKAILKDKGIYMSTELGKMSQNPFLALITPWLGAKKVLFPLPTITQKDVLYFRELAMAGKLKPVIDRKYPMERIVEAYRYVETGQKVGNVLLTIKA
ncbi:MAG: NAD(P)-dependent alcohol dehydrogenase [Saprospiraceae bacterium]|nr:NAD(P)-dependent alcohol dehydrogenase [Saprospiraceae bacterium]